MDAETASEPSSRPRTSPRLGFIVTSIFASAVGVLVAALIDNVGVAVGGWLADRQPILYHNEVLFASAGSDLALGGGMVLSLVAGAFFLTLYPGSHRYDAARLTTLWAVLHCFRQGFTQLAGVTVAPDSEFGLAFATLEVPAGLDLVVAAAGVMGLLAIALASAPAFLAFAHRQREISTPSSRFSFTVKLALIPGVVGPLLTVPLFLPDTGSGVIQTLPLAGAFTVATVLAALGTRTVLVDDYREPRGFSWLPVGWLAFLAVVYLVVLSRGLYIPPSLDSMFVDPL